MSDQPVIETLDEESRWHARTVTYCAGRWDQLRDQIPTFATGEFRASPEGPANPFLRSVIRLPRTKVEQHMPVGVVSKTYTLASHRDVAEKCLAGIREADVETRNLRCELGLSELGEWMNFRVYFPDDYSHKASDGERVGLRLECFNSVDGSSRLVILLGWLRFVCSNGMVIGETKTELRDVHNKNMELGRIPGIVCEGLSLAMDDVEKLLGWEETAVKTDRLKPWADASVTERWGKKAACRVYHICTSGYDVELTDPFASGSATEKPTDKKEKVPGSREQVQNLYDASQALSWIATGRRDAEERLKWQTDIPSLINQLSESA